MLFNSIGAHDAKGIIGQDDFGIKQALGMYHSELHRLQENGGTLNKSSLSIPGITPTNSSSETPLLATSQMITMEKKLDHPEKESEVDSEPLKDDVDTTPKSEDGTSNAIAQNIQLVPPSKLLQSPKTPPLMGFPLTSSSSSMHPLAQIASITNSLHGKPQPSIPFPFPPLGALPMKPYKSILQPLNQTQLDRYENINTEEVVRQVILNVEQLF